MKKLLGIMIAILTITSQASMSQNGNELYGKPTVTVAQPRTVIRKGPASASLKIHKPKLFVGNPRSPKFFLNDWDDDFIEVDDIITSYRRKDLHKIEHDEGISENVRWRLFLARQLALLKYREVHG